MLSAEGPITMERVTLDGTKIKANAGGNTFRRKEKLEAHLALAREQVRLLDQQAANEEKMTKRKEAAMRRQRDRESAVWKLLTGRWNGCSVRKSMIALSL